MQTGFDHLFSTGDLQIVSRLLRSVLDGLWALHDAFPYRPLGELPLLLRRQILGELT